MRNTGFRRIAATLAVACCLASSPAAIAQPQATLETVVTREGRLLHVRASIAAEAPAATCFAVVADFDRIEDFVPGMKSSDVISAPGQPIRLRQVGVASAGPFEFEIDVTLAVAVQAPTRIEFERVAGNMRQMRGGWVVEGDDARCGLGYRAALEPAFWVPPLIGPRLMRRQVEAQLRGVMQEILRRTGREPHSPP